MIDTPGRPIRRALISVHDKTGLKQFAGALVRHAVQIVSTGGTAAALRDMEIPVISVSEVTGFPEIMEGRVKTLHPAIHGAILADLNRGSHSDALSAHGMVPIGIVAVNLYPFEAVIRENPEDTASAIANIDIGGVALLRAAAKNFGAVTVASSPGDYSTIIAEMDRDSGATTLGTREELAGRAFVTTSRYDSAISRWFASRKASAAPATLSLDGSLVQSLRYGENPHQSAAFYRSVGQDGVALANAIRVQGKELSYNNILDADAALELISEFDGEAHAAAVIKHGNPCGVAVDEKLAIAYSRAVATDPLSAFGGVVAVSSALDVETATAIANVFTEVVIAPEATPAALSVLQGKPNVRVLLTGGLLSRESRRMFRSVSGGFLVQDADVSRLDEDNFRVVSSRKPSPGEVTDLLFAARVAKHVKSNAVVFAREGTTLGIGAGQMSRIDSVRLATWKASEAAKAAGRDPGTALAGSAAASDAFFPFADGLIQVAEAGATAVVQPGGSMRDGEVIEAADACGLAMVFTGNRTFRH